MSEPLRISFPYSAQPVPWFLVERVVETRNNFLVYATPDGPSYIPKSVLKPAEVEHVRQLLATHATRTGVNLTSKR